MRWLALNNRGYDNVRVIDGERVSYKGGGDGSWENGVSDKYDMAREEMGGCCVKHGKKVKDANYCGNCGVGIHGTASYKKMEDDSDELHGANSLRNSDSDITCRFTF